MLKIRNFGTNPWRYYQLSVISHLMKLNSSTGPPVLIYMYLGQKRSVGHFDCTTSSNRRPQPPGPPFSTDTGRYQRKANCPIYRGILFVSGYHQNFAGSMGHNLAAKWFIAFVSEGNHRNHEHRPSRTMMIPQQYPPNTCRRGAKDLFSLPRIHRGTREWDWVPCSGYGCDWTVYFVSWIKHNGLLIVMIVCLFCHHSNILFLTDLI